jgi:hypothetical protein
VATENNMRVATTSDANAGSYPYKVVATDSLSGLSNDSDTFNVIVLPSKLATDITIVSGTEIDDLSY